MKSIIRRLIELLVKKYGYTLITTQRWDELKKLFIRDQTGDYITKCLSKLLKDSQVDCVFDVGANDGGFAEMLRNEVGYQGWIISFEPLPGLVRELAQKAAADPKWEVLPEALGRAAGEQVFHQMAGDVFSSFHLPDASQPAKYAVSNRVQHSLKVKVNTINELWPVIKQRLGVSTLLLKMDTQGYDLEVFAGASAQLEEIPVVLSELSCVRVYQNAPTYRESLDVYEAAGYVPAMLNAISFDQNHAAVEMDAILVKKLAACPPIGPVGVTG